MCYAYHEHVRVETAHGMVARQVTKLVAGEGCARRMALASNGNECVALAPKKSGPACSVSARSHSSYSPSGGKARNFFCVPTSAGSGTDTTSECLKVADRRLAGAHSGSERDIITVGGRQGERENEKE